MTVRWADPAPIRKGTVNPRTVRRRRRGSVRVAQLWSFAAGVACGVVLWLLVGSLFALPIFVDLWVRSR